MCWEIGMPKLNIALADGELLIERLRELGVAVMHQYFAKHVFRL